MFGMCGSVTSSIPSGRGSQFTKELHASCKLLGAPVMREEISLSPHLISIQLHYYNSMKQIFAPGEEMPEEMPPTLHVAVVMQECIYSWRVGTIYLAS